MNYNPFTLRAVLLAAAFALPLTGCGGGGGGSDSFVGAADVGLDVSPTEIDSGDRTEVAITLANVIEDGVALKVRFPDALKYVRSSALLLVGQKEVDLTPKFNGLGDDSDRYLVFYLPQSFFRPSGQEYEGEEGTVVLQLEGVEAVTDGLIEVDVDVDDPLQSNDGEFSVQAPEFDPAASSPISVQAE
jgi:hypothetical protein